MSIKLQEQDIKQRTLYWEPIDHGSGNFLHNDKEVCEATIKNVSKYIEDNFNFSVLGPRYNGMNSQLAKNELFLIRISPCLTSKDCLFVLDLMEKTHSLVRFVKNEVNEEVDQWGKVSILITREIREIEVKQSASTRFLYSNNTRELAHVQQSVNRSKFLGISKAARSSIARHIQVLEESEEQRKCMRNIRWDWGKVQNLFLAPLPLPKNKTYTEIEALHIPPRISSELNPKPTLNSTDSFMNSVKKAMIIFWNTLSKDNQEWILLILGSGTASATILSCFTGFKQILRNFAISILCTGMLLKKS